MGIFSEKRFWSLFLASLTALYFELLLIRWLPSIIYYLGYYKNCILFATFLGYGVGCAWNKPLKRAVTWLPVAVMLIVVAASVLEGQITAEAWGSSEFLWEEKGKNIVIPMHLLLVGTFLLVSLLMVPLGHLVGLALEKFPPVTAYAINLSASLVGMGLFLLTSWLNFPPAVWFALFFVGFTLLVLPNVKNAAISAIIGVLTVGALASVEAPNTYWSPYSKIDFIHNPKTSCGADILLTNNNGHQTVHDFSASGIENIKKQMQTLQPGTMDRQFCEQLLIQKDSREAPYEIISPKRVLIIGGGTGNEAAAALRRGVDEIVVVEIDPLIIELGKKFHKEDPYASPRVEIVVDDARHYMARTEKKFDLIIFGFLDSTSRLSSLSNIRLDNYVYTLESFIQAKELLTSNGLIHITYYAVESYVRDRIFLILKKVFNQDPWIYQFDKYEHPNVFLFVGPAISNSSAPTIAGLRPVNNFEPEEGLILSTDNWPYLSLYTPSVSSDYIISLFLMLGTAFCVVYFTLWRSGELFVGSISVRLLFFLQGVAFMLLETGTITRMALLLGSTWIVTSLAIALVLLAGFVACFIVSRWEKPTLAQSVVFLLAMLLLNFAIDVEVYLSWNSTLAILCAAFQMYLPILGSSLLFARLYQHSKNNSLDFGLNIIGALCGGMIEYSSMVLGTRSVYLLAVAVVLLFAAISRKQSVKRWYMRPAA